MKLGGITHVVLCAAMLAGASAGQAVAQQVFNLSDDWSDEVNPFGPWRLMKSPSALFATNLPNFFGPGLPAWVDQPSPQLAHVPFWGRWITATHPFVDMGDILMHGAEFDRTGTDFTSVVWTAEADGEAVIVGDVWPAGTPGRSMRWVLRRNEVAVSEGVVNSDGPYTQDDPMNLDEGSGGVCGTHQCVQAGDRLELAFITVSGGGNVGDGRGVHLEIRFFPDAYCHCPADFDRDGFVTGLDFDAFVASFEAGDCAADFDADVFVTGLDFDAFVTAFEAGCG